ncbi:NAD(P)/FAD-dependent oxidoreductase [Ammoniphilus sp. YIM 78166]|uniref:NAD(P)/FAD-dependent oxidoreductase n=1 Tax=Ammoniphilus sp. YIM 78166 TaxID=1644106 RepID=UPI00106F29FE|nr:NAD(P)/FAD-dependent oxidoreductase [Ammoniphilus sp. YIM 78166]
MTYDCIIVGGGIAGLQGAIQLGRYQHHTLVIDAQDGRSTLCQSYHNILGWPDGVSGMELRNKGRAQAEKLGVQFTKGEVIRVESTSEGFHLHTAEGEVYAGKRLLLATGVRDRIPPELHALLPCLGISVYICPDCDGYEIRKKETVVIGSGSTGATMALTLHYWTPHITYINHEHRDVNPKLLEEMKTKGIVYVQDSVEEFHIKEGYQLSQIKLNNGTRLHTDGTFLAFGGNVVKSTLAAQLGVEMLENKHILVDARTKLTSVKHVWAAGDVVAHSEQVTIAMGEGAQAAIWIHKSLLQG